MLAICRLSALSVARDTMRRIRSLIVRVPVSGRVFDVASFLEGWDGLTGDIKRFPEFVEESDGTMVADAAPDQSRRVPADGCSRTRSAERSGVPERSNLGKGWANLRSDGGSALTLIG